MKSAYLRGGHGFSSIIAARPAVFPVKTGPQRPFEIAGGFDSYVNAWRLLLENRERFSASKGYQYDVVDLGRQVLSFLAQYYQRDIAIYLYRKDLKGFREAKARYLDLMDDMDRLLGTNEHFLFGRWIKQARSWGTTKTESDYYAKYAAILPTLWGQDNPAYPQPNWAGYAWREWNGLVGTYYRARWEFFLDEVEKQLEQGKVYQDGPRDKWGNPTFRADEILSKMADWEWAYTDHLPEMSDQPRGNAVDVAAELFDKYRHYLEMMPAQGPEFQPLLGPAVGSRDRAQVLIPAEVSKVTHREPYVK
jgi:alpha-N-acetylglucosaminidase